MFDCQGHVYKLDNLFDNIMREKKNVETALCNAYSMFPEISEIKKFIGMYEETYKHTVNISNEAASREWDRIYDEEDIGALVDKIVGSSRGKHDKKSRVKDNSMPSFDLGIESPETEWTQAKSSQEGKDNKCVQTDIKGQVNIQVYKIAGKSGGDVIVSDGKEVDIIGNADVKSGKMVETGDGCAVETMVEGDGISGIVNQITKRTVYDSVDIVTPMNNEEKLVFRYFCSIIKKKKER